MFFEHYLALNALGCGIVPINPDYRHDEMAYQMSHSRADLAVAVPERVADLRAVAAEREKPLPVLDASALPAPFPAPVARAGDWPAGLEAECSLMYTSGTTGRPKACILTNRYYLEAGRWYRDLGGLAAIREGQDRVYNPLPLYHMNAQAVTATMVMLTGNCMIVPERFSPSRWWEEIAETRATVIHYLGVVPPLLLGQPHAANERAHNVRFGLGAGVEPQLHAAFEDRFGFPLVEIWGMTETGRIFAVTEEPRLIDTRAFGRPVGGLEARIVDADDHELPRGTDGELVVRWGGPEGATPRLLRRLSRQRPSHRRSMAQRLVPHRRHGSARRQRHAVLRRPLEEHDPPFGREHRRRRGRGGAAECTVGGPGGGPRLP